ncbi:hypothetical protein [Providencia sneebia]|uniref:Uncharacterized protein n=1 Tax=Providencia sneebia DSM 19967 TaxID=1141660 RepID=K8WHQ8_9GAMM|nr:hypothetical protein OO7_04589 [Providencia sneebia DSM 19967]
MENYVSFMPKYEINKTNYKKIQYIIGRNFENQDFSINFYGIERHLPEGKEFIKLKIEHVGISGDCYIATSELERSLGTSLKSFSEKYIEYIINYNIGNYGVKFEKFMNYSEMMQMPVLISASTNLHNKQYSIYFCVKDLLVNSEFLKSRVSNWSGSLKLSLDFKVSQVLLNTQEINELSNDDIVLLSKYK